MMQPQPQPACQSHALLRFAALGLIVLTSVAAAQAAQLTGTVVDQSRTPLPALVVRLLGPSNGNEIARTTTDGEGRFAFSEVAAGSYQLVLEGPGYQPWRKPVLVSNEQATQLGITFERTLPAVAERVYVYGAVPRTAASVSVIPRDALAQEEIETPGDVLRLVPGLVIAQHAGGGKADQYLIRGFDADHGTDFALYFDGIPVNLVSHAHGQGYADLHFLIPETLEDIEVYKGPYFAEYGNLATAGLAQLRLRERFEHSFVRLQGGNFGTLRLLAGYSPQRKQVKGFLALEGYWTDGPFLNPQNLQRLNLATRWALPWREGQQLTLFFTGYKGRWNASGQIPLREVKAGRLDRFGSIDPSEGGDSSRLNFSLSHSKQWTTQVIKSQFYAVRYALDLFSNFTFFRDDPVNGDGILQTDARTLFGGHFQYCNSHKLLGRRALLTLGLDYRQDHADVGLFRQRQRSLLSVVTDSDITEQDLGLCAQQEIPLGEHLKVIVGVRYERFTFDVQARAGAAPAGQASRSITLPKLSLIATLPSQRPFSLFLNYGRGFHSNDARAVVADPNAPVLPPASGYEIGFHTQPWGELQVNFAYWLLDLHGELLWAGDEGTTELN